MVENCLTMGQMQYKKQFNDWEQSIRELRKAPQKHHLKEMEVSGIKGITKQDAVLERLQSTLWSLASKYNMMTLSSRPKVWN